MPDDLIPDEHEELRYVSHILYEGFLWPCPSGVVWCHQSHGLACAHPELEGVFIPCGIPDTIKDILAAQFYHYSRINGVIQERLDRAFEAADSPFRVVRERCSQDNPASKESSGEGWLWVEVVSDNGGMDDLYDFEGEQGVLVWTNSD